MQTTRIPRKALFLFVLLGIVVGLGPRMKAEESTQSFGHLIPPFQEVFIKLFRASVEIMNLDQLKSTAAALSAEERAAISFYLGEDGQRRVKEGLPREKQAFLDDQYLKTKTAAPAADFRLLYPHLLAVSNNHLEIPQLRQTLQGLTSEEIASQSFFMGEDGRKILFSEMPLPGVEVIFDRTDNWVFLETGKRMYSQIADYSCILYKQERLGKKLQDVETIQLKFRERPLSIYMKWVEGPWTGRELVYNEKLLGAGRVRVRESGFLGIIPITLPVDSEIAKRGSNHEVTEIGLKYLMHLIEVNYRKAVAKGELQRVNHGMAEVDGNSVFKTESILPRNKASGYYCYRMMHYIDFLRSLEIKAEVFTWDDQLYESYTYTKIKLNPGLTDKDFDPANPEYKLK